MLTFSKVRSSVIERGIRVLKVLQFGTKTAIEASSFGDDSNPVNNLTAIYGETTVNGEQVIIGYINENQAAALGEKRMYSIAPDGTVSAFMWLKNNGNLELNGSAKSAVRYEELNTALQNQITRVNEELVKIQAAGTSIGLVYVHAPVILNASAAKVDTVKLP